MLSGPQALSALDEALKDIRREEDDITKRIARGSERVARLRETEVALLRELAAVRLAPEAQAELTGRMSAAETRARDMLKRHIEEVSALEAALEGEERNLAKLADARTKARDKTTRAQAELDALADTIDAILANDGNYRAAQDAVAELSTMVVQARKKTEQAEADRDEKGRPYRDDPLFVYLWDRGYGTSTYAAGPLVRYCDELVARLVAFADARPNYAMLTDIPKRLAEHAERLAADLEAAQARLEALEAAAVETAGGKAARDAIAAAEAEIAEIDAKILAAEDGREALTEKQKEMAQGGDPTFEEAVAVLAQAMASADVAQLLADARRTRTPQDDAIVVKIEDTRLRLSEEDLDANEQRARLKTLETRRRELEDIAYEFKTSRYDDPRSTFGRDELVGDLLDEFLKGAITAGTYWGHWRASQGWRGRSAPSPRKSGSGGGGFTIPPGGFSPRPPTGTWGKPSGTGGGFSRPRTGVQGTRKSGRFKTGGGF